MLGFRLGINGHGFRGLFRGHDPIGGQRGAAGGADRRAAVDDQRLALRAAMGKFRGFHRRALR
jgi:hypothetical protein